MLIFTQDYVSKSNETREKPGQGLTNIKVLDRFLCVGNEKYTINNLLSHLKDEE